MTDDLALGADAELDRINLAQALRDFEDANQRVLDLTHQLAETNSELVAAHQRLERIEARYGRLIRALDALGRSAPMRPVRAIARRRRVRR